MATRVGVRTAARAVLAALVASASGSALALGLGELEMQSFLNEPLQARVELLDTRDLTADDIRIRLAGVEDFDRLGVDRTFFLTSIDFELDVDPGTGRGVILLTTEEAVLEPYLDLIIEARWPSGRVLREYTVLVDPPAYRQDVVTVSAVERVQAASPDKPAPAPEPAQQRTERTASGDRVAMRESSLAPGAMPDRSFSADTTSDPTAGSRYMVRRDETLWQIASRGRPEGISVQQAMLDIQRLNPEAFIDGNINRIKAGYIIYLPAAGEVDSTDLAAALEEVREQNREFQAGGPAPGVSAAATLRVSADDDGGQSPSTEPAAAAVGADAPDDAGPSVAGTAEAGPMTGSAAGDGESGNSALAAELGEQVRQMSERLDTLEQIVSLKDEQIATLEAALREAREEAAAAAAANARPGTPSPAPPRTTTPTPTPVTAPPAGPVSIPWLPVAGALLVLVLGAVLVLRRRAARTGEEPVAGAAQRLEPDEEEDVFAGVNLKSEALDEEEPPAPSEEPAQDTLAGRIAAAEAAATRAPAEEAFDRGGSRGYGERKHDDYIDEGSAGDALAEADIYIAYGRYMQAIELLDTAIAEEPDNSAYRLKLIELYVDMGEEENAAAQLDALRERGNADAVARGEALLGSEFSAEAAPAPHDVAAPDGTVDGGHAVDESAQETAPASAEDAGDADVDPAATPPDHDAAPEEDGDASLELDLDMDDADLSLEDEEPAEAGTAEEPASDREATSEPASNRVATDEPLEFDDLEIEEDIAGADDDEDDALSLDDGDDDLDLTDALMGGGADGESSDDNGDGLLIADDADQVATKLDLARAYLDMGDSEGAREILDELSGAGTDEQQREIQALLERIG